MVYLDSSALVKLVIAEAESPALRRYLADEPEPASCALARVEVLRAVRGHGSTALIRARRLLQRLTLVQIDEELLDAAAMVDPRVFENVGIDPEEWTGFAFGCGIERAAQLRHGISEIRPFWENDLRVLRQF